MTMTVVTTVTRSYLPFASVLMESVATHHPEASRLVLLLDGEKEPLEHAEIVRPADVVADQLELEILQGIYTPIEFATALKPALLMHALRSSDTVVFLDPDMRLFGPMTAALTCLRNQTGTLLTPHRVVPPAYERRGLFEGTLLIYGTYNTGFVGATDASHPFLLWWESRLRRDCLADYRNWFWVDQRIADLAPGYFDLDIFRDPTYNVGWWNLDERQLRYVDEVWCVGDERLVLMHYSGVRPIAGRGSQPQLLHSEEHPVARDATLLAATRRLEDEYVEDLLRAGYERYAGAAYGLDVTPGGRRLTPDERRRYREHVVFAESQGRTPPSPDDIPWGRSQRLRRRVRALETPGVVAQDVRALRRAWDSGG